MPEGEIPALLILGTPYVRIDGLWYKDSTAQLATGQCQDLDRLYNECRANDDKIISRVDRLGVLEPVEITLKRIRQSSGPTAGTETEPPDTKFYMETFWDENFREAREYNFRKCSFKGRALGKSSGIVATNCRFEGLTLCGAENAFVQGEIYKLGNVRDSVIVMKPIFNGNDVELYPRRKNPGSLVILYGIGVTGGGKGLYAVDEKDIKGGYLCEWTLARRLFNMDISLSEFPDWFLERYFDKKRPSRGAGRPKKEAPKKRAAKKRVPKPKEFSRTDMKDAERQEDVYRHASLIRERRHLGVDFEPTDEANDAMVDFLEDYVDDQDFKSDRDSASAESRERRDFKTLARETIDMLGEENMRRKSRGDELLKLGRILNKKLRLRGYPVATTNGKKA